jgi:hypothetical protein
MNVVEAVGMWAKGIAVGNSVELSTALAGARSASSICPQPGLGPVWFGGGAQPGVTLDFKSVTEHVAHVPVACSQPERL